MSKQFKRINQHFKNLSKNLEKFKLEKSKTGIFPKLEEYHTISEYKRKVDSYREDVYAVGIYSDNEFDVIKHIHLDKQIKLLFVLDDKDCDLMITCAIVSGMPPFKKTSKIILDVDGFKKSINRFNKEISSWQYTSKNKFKIQKLIELFDICFINNSQNITTNIIDLKLATTILKNNSSKEFKDLTLAKSNLTRKRKKHDEVYQEIQHKVDAYRIKLVEETNFKKITDDKIKASERVKKSKKNLQEKIVSEYKNDKRFLFSFSLLTLKRTFKNIFNHSI